MPVTIYYIYRFKFKTVMCERPVSLSTSDIQLFLSIIIIQLMFLSYRYFTQSNVTGKYVIQKLHRGTAMASAHTVLLYIPVHAAQVILWSLKLNCMDKVGSSVETSICPCKSCQQSVCKYNYTNIEFMHAYACIIITPLFHIQRFQIYIYIYIWHCLIEMLS